jgi:internalin A
MGTRFFEATEKRGTATRAHSATCYDLTAHAMSNPSDPKKPQLKDLSGLAAKGGKNQDKAQALIQLAADGKLTSLSLRGLKLIALPESLGELTHLTRLDVGNNLLTSLPESLGKLEHLERLDVAQNLLTSLPESLVRLGQLRELYVSANQLKALPASIGDLRYLNKLMARHNLLTTLPESLGRLAQLAVLDVSFNALGGLPEWLTQLKKLQGLDASNIGLRSLPDWMERLSGLQHLDVSRNGLSMLPEWIGHLSELRSLDVSHNHLSSLPETLSQLRRLKYFWSSVNQLAQLPESLRERLAALQGLFLHGNEGLGLPPEVLGKPWFRRWWTWNPFKVYLDPPPAAPAAIVDYYFRTRRARRPLNEGKLILVGRGGVGKTSLIQRLLHNKFDEHEPETPGIEIHQWEVSLEDGDKVRLNVWDFGGQEILHATHQFFLTERTLYLLVLSGREGNATQDAEYWLQLIRSFGGDSRVIIALNKFGQHPFDLNRGLLLEKYPVIVDFIPTDCQDARGMGTLRQLILQQTGALEHRKVDFPADWFAIKERLAGMTENFVTWERYQEICRSLGEQNAEAQQRLAEFLHILGIALNYRDDPRLKDTHVLNPRWVTEGIYSLLRAGHKASRGGGLTKSDLAEVLDAKRYPPSSHAFLLHLMEKFQLCFRLPGREERYLVPELLGESQPDLRDYLSKPGLGFRYQYEVLPEGLLPRFIVQTHMHSEGNPRWRTGVILTRDNCQAVVRADAHERRVDIHITGSEAQRRGLLAIIREKFDEQHRDLKGLTVDERVPIPGEPGVTVSYKHLLTLEEEGDEWFRPEGARQKVRVTDLLNGVETSDQRAEQRRIQAQVQEQAAPERPAFQAGGTQERKNTDVTIGIITALPKEYVAMKTLLGDCEDYHVPGSGAGRRYVLGRIPSRHGGVHRVALALADMGTNIASARATLLLEHFPAVDAILMVGIAGAVPSPQKVEDHVRLGDLVISDKKGVVQYDMVKLEEIRACPIPPSARLLEAVRLLQAGELEGSRPWDGHIDVILERLNQKRPPQTADKLFASNEPDTLIKHPKDPKRLSRKPRVFLGPVASANELLKDPAKRDSLREKFGVKAVEMEGSGIADATWNHDKGYLVVRGTCDYCDTHKNNLWQEYAAAVAAGYTRALIESIFAPKP